MNDSNETKASWRVYTHELEDKLSSANAKIAELEKELDQVNAGFEVWQRVIGETTAQNLELTAKCEKLTGYLAHEATLNLELEATVKKLREALDLIQRADDLVERGKYNSEFRLKMCIRIAEHALLLTKGKETA